MIWNIKEIARILNLGEGYGYNKLLLFFQGAKGKVDKKTAKKVISLLEQEIEKLKQDTL